MSEHDQVAPDAEDRISRDRKDAERYRWLREHWEELSGQSFAGTRPPGRGGYLLHKSAPEAVDAAIDAAMGATPAEGDSNGR